MEQPRYHIEIFWSDEDEGYIANVPDLTYCSAFGETYEEALEEVLVAMELHLEVLEEKGRLIPTPKVRRTREASRVDTGVTVVLGREALKMRARGERSVTINSLKRDIDLHALRDRLSGSTQRQTRRTARVTPFR
jgi:predicted RNase H-like HicB family nuclease